MRTKNFNDLYSLKKTKLLTILDSYVLNDTKNLGFTAKHL